MTTIIFGCLLGKFFAPYISAIISEIGVIVNKTTELRPILMGLTMSVIMGIILTLHIIKNPMIWIPPIVSSAILGVLSTTIFNLSSNSIASGMGTSGLVGQIATFSVNGMSYLPTMIILHFLLPAIITFIVYKILKKKGYIKPGDLKI